MSNRKNNKKSKPEKEKPNKGDSNKEKGNDCDKATEPVEVSAEETDAKVSESSEPVEEVVEAVEEPVAPSSSERPSGAATTDSWGMGGTGTIVEVQPAQETVAQKWRIVKGAAIGKLTHRFASIAVQEDRNDQIPLDGGVMYVIEWRREAGDGYPTASVPSVIADYLRSCNDAARKYAEL